MNSDAPKNKKLYTTFSPGDIVAEWIGNEEQARYIVLDKKRRPKFNGTYVNYTLHILWVSPRYTTQRFCPGGAWDVDEQDINKNSKMWMWETIYKSNLSWG
jgi:hypothetical protein